ncbi:hypothetical protein PMIN02_001777 [Paraphaeosphaeria minitans]
MDVMFIPSFDGHTNSSTRPLSELATKVVENAVDNGRTKLIIDLFANGGGFID